jgi:hypothetical protein
MTPVTPDAVRFGLSCIETLLSDPARWCQNRDAADRVGQTRAVTSPEACRWCLEGALILLGRRTAVADIDYALVLRGLVKQALRQAIFRRAATADLPAGNAVTAFNDNRTHDEVLDVVREAPRHVA